MDIRPVETIDCPNLDIFAKNSEAELLHYYEPNGGLFIAETITVIERALAMGCEPVAWLVEEKALSHIATVIEQCDDSLGGQIPVYVGKQEVLNHLTGFALTRGVLCAMRRPKKPDLADLLEKAGKIAVLENVMNPTNVGAIFRSAAALGVDAVLITDESADPFYRRAARVSMGTVFQVPWTTVTKGWQEKVKESGFKLVSMALCDKSRVLSDPELKEQDKLAIVLGTESTGISEEVLAASDYVVKIPMSNGVDSLNVAAASAVVFWELCAKK